MVSTSFEGDLEKFSNHDLENDLDHIASSKLCIRLYENEGSHMLEQSQHTSYSKSEQLRTWILVMNFHSNQLRERVMHNVLTRLTTLAVFSLSCNPFLELPNDLFYRIKGS